jgi:hypothetical protein
MLHGACKAYGSSFLIQAETIKTFNNTGKDIIPSVSLEFECCPPEGKATKLGDIHLNLPLRSTVNRLEDLKIASHKVEDVDRLIAEQWKSNPNLISIYRFYLIWVWLPPA